MGRPEQHDNESLPDYAPRVVRRDLASPPPAALASPTGTSSYQLSALSAASPSNRDWLATLQELQYNLTALADAKAPHAQTRMHVVSSPFVRRLFSSRSLRSSRKVAVKGKRDAESGLDYQARTQRIRVLEELILAGMRRLATIHPEPTSQTEWALRADAFARAMMTGSSADATLESMYRDVSSGIKKPQSDEGYERETVLEGFMKAFLILLLIPVTLAGALVAAFFALFYATGKIFTEICHALTFGKFK